MLNAPQVVIFIKIEFPDFEKVSSFSMTYSNLTELDYLFVLAASTGFPFRKVEFLGYKQNNNNISL